jgi:hypothetical protein
MTLHSFDYLSWRLPVVEGSGSEADRWLVRNGLRGQEILRTGQHYDDVTGLYTYRSCHREGVEKGHVYTLLVDGPPPWSGIGEGSS